MYNHFKSCSSNTEGCRRVQFGWGWVQRIYQVGMAHVHPSWSWTLKLFISKGNHPFQSKWWVFCDENDKWYHLSCQGCSTSFLHHCQVVTVQLLRYFLFVARRGKITDCLSSLLLPAANYPTASNQSQGVIISGLVNVTSTANNTCT